MFPPSIIPSLLCFVVLGISTSSAQGGNQTPWSSPESPYFRDYFMAGGSYTDDGTGNGTHAFQGQMYVERLRPLAGANHSYPLVFIHGAGQTGTVSHTMIRLAPAPDLDSLEFSQYTRRPGRMGFMAHW